MSEKTQYPEWIAEDCYDLGNGWTLYNDGQSDPVLIVTDAITGSTAQSWQEFWDKLDKGFVEDDPDIARDMRDFRLKVQQLRGAIKPLFEIFKGHYSQSPEITDALNAARAALNDTE